MYLVIFYDNGEKAFVKVNTVEVGDGLIYYSVDINSPFIPSPIPLSSIDRAWVQIGSQITYITV